MCITRGRALPSSDDTDARVILVRSWTPFLDVKGPF